MENETQRKQAGRPKRSHLFPMYEWRITRIRKKAEFVGYVEAPDEQAAIEVATKEFGIPAELQNRLVAQRVTR